MRRSVPSVNLEASLQNYFHYDTFQTGQKEIITDVLAGHDVLGVLPTGSGKSLCYQLPAKILPGLTIVVSPLISLMVDQVRQIKAYYYKEVVALHSFYNHKERTEILKRLDQYKLVFVSPELLQHQEMVNHLQRQHIALFVIDEAHCISQWGYDFRPDYLRLSEILPKLGNPSVLALTGTATPEIQTDIINNLHRDKMKKHIHSMERKNIAFTIEEVTGGEREKQQVLIERLNKVNYPTIIYFSSRKMTEQMTTFITRHVSGRRVAFYHGGMQANDRLKVQQQFMNDQIDIICCTSAFGMGINKANIRLVIHYHIPTELESFIQEVGRAGRDGKQSVGLVLYHKGDLKIPASIVENELPTKGEIGSVLQQLRQLYFTDQSPPVQKEHIEQLFQLNQTKWRMLHYQFEKRGMVINNQIHFDEALWEKALIDIHRFYINQLEIKRDKLQRMFAWLHEKDCLRVSLYRPFQKDIPEEQINCCSHCGFLLKDFHGDDGNLHHETSRKWQEKLRSLLLIGEKP